MARAGKDCSFVEAEEWSPPRSRSSTDGWRGRSGPSCCRLYNPRWGKKVRGSARICVFAWFAAEGGHQDTSLRLHRHAGAHLLRKSGEQSGGRIVW